MSVKHLIISSLSVCAVVVLMNDFTSSETYGLPPQGKLKELI